MSQILEDVKAAFAIANEARKKARCEAIGEAANAAHKWAMETGLPIDEANDLRDTIRKLNS